jgi:organic hydroperoxide reductase OsmC/OhrA
MSDDASAVRASSDDRLAARQVGRRPRQLLREHTWWQIDPEKMFVATIASAHMLSWLHLAFGMGSEVLSYSDEAHGIMTELSEGVYWVSEVLLHPNITYSERSRATPVAEARLHELAHEQCFIANLIKTKVTVHSAPAA